MKIENWSMGMRQIEGASPYTAPELLQVFCLFGEVYGHPKHKDGTFVSTSRLKKLILLDRWL